MHAKNPRKLLTVYMYFLLRKLQTTKQVLVFHSFVALLRKYYKDCYEIWVTVAGVDLTNKNNVSLTNPFLSSSVEQVHA